MRCSTWNMALAALWLAGCATPSAGRPMRLPPREDLSALEPMRAQMAQTLPQSFVSERGWFAPRREGRVDLEGDSLLWTGLAMRVLPCAEALPMLEALEASAEMRGGAFVRYEPLPPKFDGNEVSRDGVIGAAFGLLSLDARCPVLRPRIAALWGDFIRFVKEHGGGALYPGTTATLTVPFGVTLDLVTTRLLGADEGETSEGELAAAEAGHLMSTARVTKARRACYPAHLVAMQVLIADACGRPFSQAFMDAWCDLTDGAGMPLADWMCSRAPAILLLGNPRFDPRKWMYEHQRCEAWERPDLGADEESPHLDWLLLYDLAARGRAN